MSLGQHLLLRIDPERRTGVDRLAAYDFLHYSVNALVGVHAAAVGPGRATVMASPSIDRDPATIDAAHEELHRRRTSIVEPRPLIVVVPTLPHMFHEEPDALAAERRLAKVRTLMSRGPQHGMHVVAGLTLEVPRLGERAWEVTPPDVRAQVEVLSLGAGSDLRPAFAVLSSWIGHEPGAEDIARAMAAL